MVIILLTSLMMISLKAQFILSGEHMYNGDTIGLYQADITLDNFLLNNVGHIHISSVEVGATKVNIKQDFENGSHLGPGSFELVGNQQFELNFNKIFKFGHISINNGNQDCFVSDQGFEVDSTIYLNAGKLIIEKTQSFIKLNSEEVNAIEFWNNPNSQTYILGRLIREVAAFGNYLYPVGNENSMFLIGAESSEGKTQSIGVKFNDQLVNEWIHNNHNQTSNLNEQGGWELDNEFSKANSSMLKLTMSKLPFYDVSEEVNMRIAYFDKDLFPLTSPVFSNEAFTTNTSSSVSASFQKPSGFYALAVIRGFQTNLIPNFVIGKSGYNFHFEIPGAQNLQSAELEVYNRWGQKVYASNNYINQLDTRSLAMGTYYYILRYDEGEGKKSYNSFFEVYK